MRAFLSELTFFDLRADVTLAPFRYQPQPQFQPHPQIVHLRYLP